MIKSGTDGGKVCNGGRLQYINMAYIKASFLTTIEGRRKIEDIARRKISWFRTRVCRHPFHPNNLARYCLDRPVQIMIYGWNVVLLRARHMTSSLQIGHTRPWTQRPKDMQGRQYTSWIYRHGQQYMLAVMLLSTPFRARASPTVAGQPPEPRATMELERQCVQQVAAAVTALAHAPANDWWEALGTLPTGHMSTRIPVRGSKDIYEVFGSISACRPSVHIPCAEVGNLVLATGCSTQLPSHSSQARQEPKRAYK